MNEAGEVTSHLQGMWYRTIKFIESGIKPVYVFDGKPPVLKSGQVSVLAMRRRCIPRIEWCLWAVPGVLQEQWHGRAARRHVHDADGSIMLSGAISLTGIGDAVSKTHSGKGEGPC